MRHSLSSTVLLLGIGLSFATLTAQGPVRTDAVAPPAPRVGVVDRQSVERATGGAESVEAYQQRKMSELNSIQDAIRVLQKRIIDGGDSLAPEAREEILAEIRRRQDELRKADQATKDELKARAERSTGLVSEHIAKVAAKRGLEVVLDRSAAAVLWANPVVDLTNDVIASIRQAAAAK